MSYELTIREKAGYLHFLVTGENSPETVRGYLSEIAKTCQERNCPTVLIEENLQGPGLGLLDIFQISSQGSNQAWPHVRRIAYVDANREHSAADMKFAETVASNRGLNIRLFSNVQEAEQWLSKTAQPESVSDSSKPGS